ncbi:hypothetical protein WMY93_031782 [Mugilogobius chulae]|uniref:Reverse transcriptase n=1 Tax=Mugilogobius chulae TaxID=88201 RepID=A0AAW0MFA4_9GOBI
MECRSIIQTHIKKQWQHKWDEETKGRHLHSIAPTVDDNYRSGLTRQDDINLTRLRLGHCGLASGLFLIGKHADGCCECCGVPETVAHVVMRCPASNRHGSINNIVVTRPVEGSNALAVPSLPEINHNNNNKLLDYVIVNGACLMRGSVR